VKGMANDRQTPAPHQAGRTDFPYPAFRAASSQGIRTDCLTSFPRYSHRQSPPTVTVVQQLLGIIAPQGFGAVVFAPQPLAQPVPYPVLGFAERTRALPVMEVSTPAPQQLAQVIHCLGYAPMQCPVAQLVPHFISQSLPTFSTGFDVRIPTPAFDRTLPAHTKAQEVEPVPAVYQVSLFFIELEAPRRRKTNRSFRELAGLSTGHPYGGCYEIRSNSLGLSEICIENVSFCFLQTVRFVWGSRLLDEATAHHR